MIRPVVRIFVVIGLLLLFVVTACRTDDEGNNDSAGGPVPESVQSIEEDAEDAIDMILAGNWEKVQSDAQSIDQHWKEFLDSSAADDVTEDQRGAMAAAIGNLSSASADQENLPARQAANNVSRIIIDVFDSFETNVPTDISRLDYLERQIIIDSERGDWATVQQDIEMLRATFERVKQDVIDAGGTDEMEEFAASIDTQQQLVDQQSTDIVNEANVALELVDRLESVY